MKIALIVCFALNSLQAVLTDQLEEIEVPYVQNLSEEDQESRHNETNSTALEMGPPDSHEAMNNRDKGPTNSREKRSYEFLIGLINNNSRYEVTNVDHESENGHTTPAKKVEATDLLLELLVKISTHPDQWAHVHNFLRNLDNDLETSRKIMHNVYHLNEDGSSRKESDTTDPNIEIDKKLFRKQKEEHDLDLTKEFVNPPKVVIDESTEVNTASTERVNPTITSKETQKMIIVLGGSKKHKTNNTEEALETNKWPRFEEEPSNKAKEIYGTENESPKYPWQLQGKPKQGYPHNFAYHRVTGQPYSSSYNKNPKAYIAVSVIAPKPLNHQPEEDMALEDELRQLKPWSHKQSLKQDMRNRWTMSEAYNNNYSP